jgi:hypothetical protein
VGALAYYNKMIVRSIADINKLTEYEIGREASGHTQA